MSSHSKLKSTSQGTKQSIKGHDLDKRHRVLSARTEPITEPLVLRRGSAQGQGCGKNVGASEPRHNSAVPPGWRGGMGAGSGSTASFCFGPSKTISGSLPASMQPNDWVRAFHVCKKQTHPGPRSLRVPVPSLLRVSLTCLTSHLPRGKDLIK